MMFAPFKTSYYANVYTYAGCKESQFYSLPFRLPVASPIFGWHVLAHKSFQLARKPFLISRIDYKRSVIWISPKTPLAQRAS